MNHSLSSPTCLELWREQEINSHCVKPLNWNLFIIQLIQSWPPFGVQLQSTRCPHFFPALEFSVMPHYFVMDLTWKGLPLVHLWVGVGVENKRRIRNLTTGIPCINKLSLLSRPIWRNMILLHGSFNSDLSALKEHLPLQNSGHILNLSYADCRVLCLNSFFLVP